LVFSHSHTQTHVQKNICIIQRNEERRDERREKKVKMADAVEKRSGRVRRCRIELNSLRFLRCCLGFDYHLDLFSGVYYYDFFSLFFFFCFFLQLFISCCSSFFVTIKYSLTQWRPIIREGTLLWFLSNLHISFHFFLLILLLLSFFFIFTFSYFFCWCFAFFFSFLGFYFDAVEKYTVREKKKWQHWREKKNKNQKFKRIIN